jgi:hypothetical protein
VAPMQPDLVNQVVLIIFKCTIYNLVIYAMVLSGLTLKNIPLRKMQSKSGNGLAKLKLP